MRVEGVHTWSSSVHDGEGVDSDGGCIKHGKGPQAIGHGVIL